MENITIEAKAVQSFTVNKNDFRYDFTLRFIGSDTMIYDLSIDEQPVMQGARFVVGEMMLPYKYQEKDGNFILYVPDDATPDYTEFGQSQFLRYLTASEAQEVRHARA